MAGENPPPNQKKKKRGGGGGKGIMETIKYLTFRNAFVPEMRKEQCLSFPDDQCDLCPFASFSIYCCTTSLTFV